MNRLVRQRRAIFTVPGEIGRERCWPRAIAEIRDSHLRAAATGTARQWLNVRRKEGDTLVESAGLHVYGPFPSPIALQAYVTNDHFGVDAAQREALVTDRDASPHAFSHYFINADFVVASRAPAGALEGVTT